MYNQMKTGEMISSKDKGRTNGDSRYGFGLEQVNGFGDDSFVGKSEHRESLEKLLARKVSSMEEDFKSAFLEYFDEVDRERSSLIDEVRLLQDDVQNMEKGQAHKHRNDGERGKLIKRLTSNGKVLVQEIERLKKDVTRFKEKENNLVKENNKMNREMVFKQKEIEELEHGIKVLRDEISYLKVLADDSGKLKDRENEIVNLENQVLFQQKMCKEYSLELADKDDKINKLKQRCSELEMNIDYQMKENNSRYEEEKKSCERELESAKALTNELEIKCEAMLREREVTQGMVESGKRQLRDLNEELEMFRQREGKIERRYAKEFEKKKQMEDEIRALRDNNLLLHRQVDALDKDLAIGKMKMDTYKYEDEILQKDLKSYESQLKELGCLEKEWKVAERKFREELLVANTKVSHYESENETLRRKISQLEEEVYGLQDKSVQLQTECDSKEIRDNELQREILSHVKQCSKYEQDLHVVHKRLEKTKEELEHCNAERGMIQRDAKELHEKVSALEIVIEAGKEEETRAQKQIVAVQKRYAKLERDLSAAHHEIENTRNERESLCEKYHHIEAAYDQYAQENSKLKEALKGSNDMNENLEEKCKRFHRDIKELEIEQENLERSLRNKNSDYEHARSEFEYKEKDNKRLQQMLGKAEEDLRDAQHEVSCLKREGSSDQQRLEMIRMENKDYKYKVEELRNEVEKNKTELVNSRDECNTLQRAHLKIEASNKALTERNEVLEREAEEVRKQMLDVRFRSSEIDGREAKWKSEVEVARNNVVILEDKCSEFVQSKRNLEEKIASFCREQSMFEQNKDELIRTNEQINERAKLAENEIIFLREKLTESEGEIGNLKKERRNYDDQQNRADEETGRWKGKLEQAETELIRVQEKLQKMQDRCWDLDKSNRMVAEEKDSHMREVVRLKDKQEDMEKQLVNFHEREEKWIAEKQQMKREIEDCLVKLDLMNQVKQEASKDHDRIANEMLMLKNETEALKQKLRESGNEIINVHDDLRKEKNQTRKLENEVESLNLEKRKKEQEVERINSHITDLEALTSGKMKESGQMAIELMKAERKIKSIEMQCTEFETERNELEKEKCRLVEEINVMKVRVTTSEDENERIQEQLNNYENKMGANEVQIKEEVERVQFAQTQMQSIQKEASSAKEKLESENRLLAEELEMLRRKQSKHVAETDNLRNELHQIELQLAVKEERCHILEIKLHEVSKSRAQIEGKFSEAQGVIDTQREKIGELNKRAEALTIESDSKVNESEELRKESEALREENLKLEAYKNETEKRINEIVQHGDDIENEREKLQSALKLKEEELIKVKEELENINNSYERSEDELVTAKKRFSAIEREYRSIGEEKDKLEKQIEIAEVEYEELHKELEDREKENLKLKESVNTLRLLKEDVDMLWENEKNLRSGEREQLEYEIDELRKKITDLETEVGKMNYELEDSEDKAKEMSEESERYVKMLQDVNREKEEEKLKHNEELQRMEEQVNLIEESGKMQLNEMREKLKAAEDAKNQYAANYAWKMEQNGEEKVKELDVQINDLKNKVNDMKSRAEKSDAEIFRLKAQLDWMEEDRRESEQAKTALQSDFNKCVGELDQSRGELMESQIEREQLKQELRRVQEEVVRKPNVSKSGETEQLLEVLDENRRQTVEINKVKDENRGLKAELESLTKEKDKLEALLNRHDNLTRQLSSETEEAKRQKYEKDLLTSQLEAVARERRQLDRLLAEKEEARIRLENENEALRKAMEKSKTTGKGSTHVTSAALHDEKAALKNELSEVYMKHQRDLEKIEKFKIENSKLSREIEQLRRDLQIKEQELEGWRSHSKVDHGSKKEISSIFIQPESEAVSLTVKAAKAPPRSTESITPDAITSESQKGFDDFALKSISNNPFLTLDKARSKSVDDLGEENPKRNPFAPSAKSTQAFQRDVETKPKTLQKEEEIKPKPPQPPVEQQTFSLLSDDLRASVDNLDTVGIGEEDAKGKELLPGKDYVNKLRANFEGGKTGAKSTDKKSKKQKRPKVDIFS